MTVIPIITYVGGGVHLGERAEDAVVREVYEETGERYEIDRLAFIHENFFTGTKTMAGESVRCHEVALYFLMKPRGVITFRARSVAMGDVPERMVWLPVDRLSDYKAFPAFFGEKLRGMRATVEHIVTID
jgi:ADP-ribose pyrophosphatase YjhB (NUDIX family)